MSAAPAPEVPITVNGEPRRVAAPSTVADVVAEFSESPKGIAVARNAEVVPRSEWATTEVGAGDHIEVLTAAQGG